MSKTIFLSYSHQDKDRDWVRRLVDALSEKGVDVWYDETEIKPGDSWADRTEEGLRESAYVVFIVTSETTSNWSAAELGAALALRKPVIPIVAEDVPFENIPGPIKLRKYLPKGDPVTVADEIVGTIGLRHEGDGKTGK
jgi:hypothetical protein